MQQVERSTAIDDQSAILSAQALSLIQGRLFKAVSRDSESRVVNLANERNDIGMLQQIIKHGADYQVGCIYRAVVALRHAGHTEETITADHLEACEEMIRAIIGVMRADLSATNEIRKKSYEEMTDYAVVHHKESRVIATILRERKVSSLRELIIILNGIREIDAGVLGEGFI
jgi:hypothetical protein